MTTTGWARADASRRPVPFVVLVRLLVIITVGWTGSLAFASPTGAVAGAHAAATVHAIGTEEDRGTSTSVGAMSLDASHGGISRGVGGHGEAGGHEESCAHTGGACPGACAASAGALPVGWRACVANGAMHASVAGRTADIARARAPEAPFRPPIPG